MGDCQNYGLFLGPYYNTGPNTGPNLGDPKRDHNFDNPLGHAHGYATDRPACSHLCAFTHALVIPGEAAQHVREGALLRLS